MECRYIIYRNIKIGINHLNLELNKDNKLKFKKKFTFFKKLNNLN